MKIVLDITKEKINKNLNQIHEFQDTFLRWAVDGESPADYPKDILHFLRIFNDIDSHFLDIIHLIENDKIESEN
jgi:hypothetical protein